MSIFIYLIKLQLRLQSNFYILFKKINFNENLWNPIAHCHNIHLINLDIFTNECIEINNNNLVYAFEVFIYPKRNGENVRLNEMDVVDIEPIIGNEEMDEDEEENGQFDDDSDSDSDSDGDDEGYETNNDETYIDEQIQPAAFNQLCAMNSGHRAVIFDVINQHSFFVWSCIECVGIGKMFIERWESFQIHITAGSIIIKKLVCFRLKFIYLFFYCYSCLGCNL